MKTYTVLINLKDHTGCYRILGVTVDDHAPRPSIGKIHAVWKKKVAEAYLKANPHLWTEECERLVENGADRHGLIYEILEEEICITYEMEADSFIKYLKEEHGFFEPECLEFGFGV